MARRSLDSISLGLLAFALGAFAAGQSPLVGQVPRELLTEPLGEPVRRCDCAGESSQPYGFAPVATFEEQVAELVNIERQNCSVDGCPKPPLKLQTNAWWAAHEHSQSMAEDDYFSHVDMPNGCTSLSTRMTNAGYTGFSIVGENIAASQSSPAAVMAAWMGSTGHRANILGDCLPVFGIECPYRDLGVGYFLQADDAANVDTNTTGAPPPGGPDCDCNDAGESCSAGPFVRYWTQTFGARGGTGGYPVVIDREAFLTTSGLVDLYVYQPPGSAPQMRFANETGAFSIPQAFTTSVPNWSLTPGDGLKAVIAEVTTGSGTFRTCDRIWVDGSGDTSFVFAEGFECDGLAAWSDVVP